MDLSIKRYGVPEFEELKTSTRTVMIYSNVEFNLLKIFKNFYITEIDVPLTKKKKNVDKRQIKAPYGSIISIQQGNEYRGINLRKTAKHWCRSNCRETVKKGEKTVEINTVIEIPVKKEGTDIYQIYYYCTKCKQYYTLKQLKKIRSFLNQVTIVISLGDVILNIMMFKDNFKVAGCRTNNDAVEVTMILWEDYIKNIDRGWVMRDKFKNEQPSFLFRPVMRNVDFKLGFYINRTALNTLMNSEKYSKRIYMSQCETTSHTNVNIKLYTKKPPDYEYDCLVFSEEGKKYFINVRKNVYKTKKKKDEKYTTFIVFGSSETIVSGRYDSAMKKDYEFIVKEIFENRDIVEEKIIEPNLDLITYLDAKDKGKDKKF